MSLEQLQKQIDVATRAMEKATMNGDKHLKGKLKEELAIFNKVLENSKQRLKELEKVKQQCDRLSETKSLAKNKSIDVAEKDATREKTRKEIEEDEEYNKPIIIPWLTNKKNKDVEVDEEREPSGGGRINLASSFVATSGECASVSTLGSQVFGTSEITKYVQKEQSTRLELKQLQACYEQEIAKLNSQLEERENPIDFARSQSKSLMQNVLSAENIADQELQARENYIKASKEHQALQRSGIKPESMEWKQSEKHLRDCYAQIEYWECLGEEHSNSGSSKNGKALKGAFSRLDPRDTKKGIDFDTEETRAREAYLHAMANHQALVNAGKSTISAEWQESQKELQDCLTALQYWEERRDFVRPPSCVESTPLYSL